ncbi:MAG: serine/threonine-protein kinase [Myxococcaceae bacterium]|nr:serine/threonine-protein kinase [Myxococcaceae bacterium]
MTSGATVESMDFNLAGTELGPWHLEKVLGEGAMGTVYLARHQRIGRTAAVKVLKAEHAKNPDLVQRFIAEATAVNAIKNEHIVEVFDFGEQLQPDGSSLAWCVMELLDGQPLSAHMAQHFTLARTLKLGWQLSKALHAAHQIGVVHRDVKPENMFLHRKGDDPEFLKVLDFGIAKLLKPIGDIPQSGTAAGIVIGTPEYMAPEQALGSPTDRRADIYAVGLVLYELVAGVQPFRGDTFGKLVVEITSKPPPPLPDVTALGEPVHPVLKAIITRCLAKEPERRFQSAEDLAQALEPFVTGAPIRPLAATPQPPPRTLEAPKPERQAAPSAIDTSALRPSRVPLVVGALVLVGVVVGAAVLLSAQGTPVAPPAPPPPAPVEAARAPPIEAVPVAPMPARVRLEVRSTPPGALVMRTDTQAELGVTPLSLELDPVDALPLSLSLSGHVTDARTVALQANATLDVDLAKTPEPEAVKAVKSPQVKKPVSRDGVVDPFAP